MTKTIGIALALLLFVGNVAHATDLPPSKKATPSKMTAMEELDLCVKAFVDKKIKGDPNIVCAGPIARRRDQDCGGRKCTVTFQ